MGAVGIAPLAGVIRAAGGRGWAGIGWRPGFEVPADEVRGAAEGLGPEAVAPGAEQIGDSQAVEEGLGHREGDLGFAGEDDIGPGATEPGDLGDVPGAGDDPDPRIQFAGDPDRLQDSLRVRRREDQGRRCSRPASASVWRWLASP